MANTVVLQRVFPNGLTLLAEPMPSVQSAALTIWIPAGAIYDREDRQGTASVLAEWMARGAGGRDGRALLNALDDLGFTHGESAQSTHISVSGATLGSNLLPALEIVSDMILRPALDDADVEPIRSLMLQSLRSLEDDPASKAAVEVRRHHFPAPWGRLSQGTVEGLEALAPEDARRHYETLFNPRGTIVAVAGAIDWSALVETVERLFGAWHGRDGGHVIAGPAGPKRDHILKETQQIQIACAVPVVPVGHPSYYQARAAVGVLGGYSSSRLFTEVREKRGLCYSIHAGYESFKDHAALICQAGTAPDRAGQTLEVTLDELRRLVEGGVEAEELDTMRAGLKASLVMQQESSSSRAMALASDWYFLGRVRPVQEIAAALDSLTARSVSEYCASLNLDEMTLLTLGPVALCSQKVDE